MSDTMSAIYDNLESGRSADYGITDTDGIGAALRAVYADGDDLDDVQLSALRSAGARAGVTFSDLDDAHLAALRRAADRDGVDLGDLSDL